MNKFDIGDTVELIDEPSRGFNAKPGARATVTGHDQNGDPILEWDKTSEKIGTQSDGNYHACDFVLVSKEQEPDIGQKYLVTKDIEFSGSELVNLRKGDYITIEYTILTSDKQLSGIYLNGPALFKKSVTSKAKDAKGFVNWWPMDFKTKINDGIFVLQDICVENTIQTNHGRSTCFACGGPTKRLDLITSISDFCPKCKK